MSDEYDESLKKAKNELDALSNKMKKSFNNLGLIKFSNMINPIEKKLKI